MENASKALIIAGEILIAILILSLLLYAWGRYSKYKNSNNELDNIENTAEFNEQFTNYDRDDVEGYEILTLINKVVDYNERKTSDSTINANSYNAIKIQIDFLEDKNRTDLTYSTSSNLLFKRNIYTDSQISAKNRFTPGSFKYEIIDKVDNAMKTLPGIGNNSEKANKVAKNIEYIFLDTDEENQWKKAASVYNSCTGTKLSWLEARSKFKGKSNSNSSYVAACTCYEYMQFKRTIFSCIDIKYDSTTKRVSEMYFSYKGKR